MKTTPEKKHIEKIKKVLLYFLNMLLFSCYHTAAAYSNVGLMNYVIIFLIILSSMYVKATLTINLRCNMYFFW